MPSRKAPFFWLLEKEWRELVVSKAWWILLVAMGPLVGLSFISAVRTYAEISGLGGTSAGVGEALAPLIGIWAPTFSACELAAVFLLPFVAIKLTASDRQSGALKLELQQHLPPGIRIAAKAMVLMAGWILAMLPLGLAMILWKSYGGTLYAPELAAVGIGHLLNAGLTIALAAAMASVAEHPSTAAILTLSATVGTWIINFFGAIQGGWWERISNFTPSAMVAQFQHGLVRLDTTLVAVALTAGGLAFAAVWMRLGDPVRSLVYRSIAVGAAVALGIFLCTLRIFSWDLSENRYNSFSEGDEMALAKIQGSLRMEAHLAPEDPRRVDLERQALSKLRRVMPHLEVHYISSTTVGMFEQTAPNYGEIWYFLNGKKTMSRITTSEGVLESIYEVAGVSPPQESDEVFRGHPLAKLPSGANIVFYGLWPVMVAIAALWTRRYYRW